MALQTGAAGGQGGAGSYGTAVSRIDVIDPHIVIMMRDVMDAAETAPRLKVSGAAGSGGGGGGVAFDASGNASQGETPGAGDTGPPGWPDAAAYERWRAAGSDPNSAVAYGWQAPYPGAIPGYKNTGI